MKVIIGKDCKNCKYCGIMYGARGVPKVLCNIDDKDRNYGQFFDCHFYDKKEGVLDEEEKD